MTTTTGTRTTGRRPARIFLVDDHPIVRRGLSELISHEPDLTVCGEADDAPGALRQAADTNPDLMVIDISLKSGSGIELIKQIKAGNPAIRMLVVSMHDETLYAERAIRAGASGYINKDEAAESLINALRQVLAGKVYLSRRMTDTLVQQAMGRKQPAGPPMEALSDRELEVFELIGQGLTTRRVAEKLHLSVKTIDTYRSNIKDKLNLTNSTELTRFAVQWVLENK
jgi:DNA-binding NarL/FixJ family response regulator